MSRKIKEYMTTGVELLPQTLTVGAAKSQLASANVGVVLDEKGEPIALLKKEELAQATNGTLQELAIELPPIITVGGEVEIDVLLESELFILFDFGALGAVILGDGNQVIGVLPVEIVDEYLGSGAFEPPDETRSGSGTGGDSMLGGAHQPPSGTIRCAQCHFINSNIFFIDDDDLPRCQNPLGPSHTLKLAA